MKKIAVSLSILVILIALLIAPACGGKAVPPLPPSATPTPSQPVKTAAPATTAMPSVPATLYPLTVTDALGRKVILKKAPQRIVSLAPSNTEILFALGLEDRIIGVTEYCNYPEAAKSKPRVSSYTTPNMEKLVSLEPDLILAESIHETMVLPALEKLNFTVVVLKASSIGAVLDNIKQVGQITDKNQLAVDLVKDISAGVSLISAKTASLSPEDRLRVLYVVWWQPIWTMGGKTFASDLIKTAGGTNIFGAAFEDSRTVSLEAVIAANPQVIIASGMGTSGDITFNAVKNESRLKSAEALVRNRVYKIDDPNLVERPGPRIAQGLQELARIIHPELFGRK